MSRMIYTGNIRALQARFIADVGAQRQSDPLASLTVLVPGQLVRLALRRELARACGGHANMDFLTLHDLATRIARPALINRGLRTLQDVQRLPLLAVAIERAQPLEYFGEVARREGFQRVLWRTLEDLAMADIGPDELQDAVRRYPASRQTHVRKLRDLSALTRHLHEELHAQKRVDTPALLRIAAEAATANGDASPLVLYGIAELRPLEQRFFTAVCGSRDITAYVPDDGSPACEYVRPVLDYLRGLGLRVELLPPSPPEAAILAQVQHRLAHPPSVAAALPADDSLRIISAPDRTREADVVTREILFPRSALHAPQPALGVLLRNEDLYAPLLRGTFGQSGVQGYFHACHRLRDTVAGRACGLLAALLDGTYRRMDVLEFLLTAPLRWPAELEGGADDLPVAEWHHLCLMAGITQGRAQWTSLLERLERRLRRAAERAGGDDDETGVLSRTRLASLGRLRRFMDWMFDRITAVNRRPSWQERLSGFWNLLSELTILDPEEAAAVWSQLASIADFDQFRYSLTTERFMSALRQALDAPASREGRFQVHEPTVATLSAAFGLVFDAVLIPGLVEREFPRLPPPDPLLLDEEKSWLAGEVGKPQAFASTARAARLARERFLFHTAVQSARETVVLCYSRVDTATGRSRIPSHYLLEVGRLLTGRALDYTELAAAIRETAWGEYLPAHHLQPAALDPSVTELQYDVAHLAAALQSRDPRRLAGLLRGRPLLQRALLAESRRFGPPEFGRFDGVIETAAVRQTYAAWHGMRGTRISATRMERYAACPFQMFVLNILDLQPVDEPEPVPRLTALERGLLIHEILERFYRREHAAGRLPLSDDAPVRFLDFARRLLAVYRRDFPAIPRLLWDVDAANILAALDVAVRIDQREDSGFIPRYFERQFEFGYAPAAALTLHGKIDRIDIHPHTGMARVVDYKSGSSRRTVRDDLLRGGRALQLPVYRLAVEHLLNLVVAEAQYRYVGSDAGRVADSFTEADWVALRPRFEQIVATISGGIAAGRLFPWPDDETCRNCAAKPVCGSGRFTPKCEVDTEQTRPFRALREVAE